MNWAIDWGTSNQWLIGPGGSNDADSYCCGQTYLDLYRLASQPTYITDITNRVNAWVASSATNQLYWIDAFFMAGPTFARMGNLTGNTNYYEKLWQMYSYMKGGLGLFDTNASLWYERRDLHLSGGDQCQRGQSFLVARQWLGVCGTGGGAPANAHECAALSGFRYDVPNHGARDPAAVQGADGMWRTSLYDAAEYPNPETSGTGFFTYGLAWGIRSG